MKRLSIVLVSITALAGPCAGAFAQTVQIPPDAISAPSLTDGHRNAIRAFIDEHKKGLSGDAAELRRDRTSLAQPLLGPNVSVQFRQEYARTLGPVLQPMLAASEHEAINALNLAGELATPAMLQLLAQSLGDTRVSVRYASLVGYRATFDAVSRSAPAIAPEPLLGEVRSLAAAMLKEDNPQALDGFVLALGAASRVPEGQVAGLRSAALGALVRGVAAKAADAPGASLDNSRVLALLRGGQIVRDALTDPGRKPPAPELQKEIGGMAGDLLAHVARRLKAVPSGEELEAPTRTLLAQLTAVAEADFFFAASALGGQPGQTSLSKDVSAGRDPSFLKNVETVIGGNGAATKPPFGFQAGRFKF
ncbi:MAG: hypothetical protein JNM07_09465 [Phycisphaerae bacterium]|nr:hypothetical protein [Phycisphaerae bacterium]